MSACYSYSSGLLTYSSSNRVPEHMQVVFDDSRLNPIRAKVEAGERLSLEDGVALYRTADILAVGYLANLVRERLHGSRTYFNVNRHINPTDVCVASCRLCAFGKRVRDPKAYTMSLEEVWQRAGEGWSEAVTEFHIGGGLHPGLVLRDAARPQAALSHRAPEGLHHGGDRLPGAAHEDFHPRDAGAAARRGHGFPAGGRRRDLQRARAAHHLRSQNRRQRVAGDGAHRSSTGPALQLHHVVRPPGE